MKPLTPNYFKKGITKLCSLANTFSAVKYRPGVTCLDGTPISQHEEVHTRISHDQTGWLVTLFSSHDANKKGYDSVKYNNNFIPLKDASIKLPLHDEAVNHVPDPNKGGQFAIFFTNPKDVPPQALIEDKQATEYLKPKQNILNAAYTKFKISERSAVTPPTPPSKEPNNLPHDCDKDL